MIPELGGDTTQWWKLATIISCGTLAGAVIPELVKVFTSTESRHVREVVTRVAGGRRFAQHPVRASWPATLAAYWLGLRWCADGHRLPRQQHGTGRSS